MSLKFGQNRRLVSMVTDRVMMEKKTRCLHFFSAVFHPFLFIDVATFSQLFLIKSFSYLQVAMAYIRAWMSSKFGQIRSGTTELAALEQLKN